MAGKGNRTPRLKLGVRLNLTLGQHNHTSACRIGVWGMGGRWDWGCEWDWDWDWGRAERAWLEPEGFSNWGRTADLLWQLPAYN